MNTVCNKNLLAIVATNGLINPFCNQTRTKRSVSDESGWIDLPILLQSSSDEPFVNDLREKNGQRGENKKINIRMLSEFAKTEGHCT